MALRLADIVLRRTGLGASGRPSDEALTSAAAIASGELGWDAPRIAAELAAVKAVYETA
jgi:glycerol-3-phosphate dehydrogenase